MSLKPQYEPGDTLNIVRYLPPLPKGATVMVKRIEYRGENYQYVVEGRRTPEGETIEVWADEGDLKEPLIFEAPRKKRKGSIAYELQSALATSGISSATTVSSMPVTNGHASAIAPAAERPRRRRRKSDEPIGIIATRTGRSGRTRDIDSLLFSERARTAGNGRSSPVTTNGPNTAPAATPEPASKKRRPAKAGLDAPTARDGKLPKAESNGRPKPKSAAPGRTANGTRKKSARSLPAAAEAPIATRAKAPAGRAGAAASKPKRTGAQAESAKPARTKPADAGTKRSTRGNAKAKTVETEPTVKSRAKSGVSGPAALSKSTTSAKPAKAPARRRRKRKSTAAAARAKAIKGSAVPAAVTKQEPKPERQTRKRPETGPGIPDVIAPKRSRKSVVQQQSLGAMLDGILGAQTFPGGLLLGGAGGNTPIIIIIVNGNGSAVDAVETARRRGKG